MEMTSGWHSIFYVCYLRGLYSSKVKIPCVVDIHILVSLVNLATRETVMVLKDLGSSGASISLIQI